MQELFNLADNDQTAKTWAEYQDAIRSYEAYKTEDKLAGLKDRKSYETMLAAQRVAFLRERLSLEVLEYLGGDNEALDLFESGKFAGVNTDLVTGDVTIKTIGDILLGDIAESIGDRRGRGDLDKCDCPACTAARMIDAGKSNEEVGEYLQEELNKDLGELGGALTKPIAEALVRSLKGEGDKTPGDILAEAKGGDAAKLDEGGKMVNDLIADEENRKEGERIAEDEARDEIERELAYEDR